MINQARTRKAQKVLAGTFNTLVAGTVTGMNSVSLVAEQCDRLAANITVLAETSTLTISAFWQVSNDNGVTWLRALAAANAPADVVLATGTAGADAAVTRVLPFPPELMCYPLVRLALVNGVVTGGAADTFSVSYNLGFDF